MDHNARSVKSSSLQTKSYALAYQRNSLENHWKSAFLHLFLIMITIHFIKSLMAHNVGFIKMIKAKIKKPIFNSVSISTLSVF
jgi:hypothetical protein